jgi:plastocyanin
VSRSLVIRFIAASALVALLAACGGGGGGGGGPTKTAVGGKIEVNAYDSPRFDVGTIKASPGPLTVTLNERGSQDHTFTIPGHDLDLKVNAGSKSATGTVNLTPGTYTFQCDTPGHAAQGMRGKIVVA